MKRDVESAMIRAALSDTNGSLTLTAKMLGVDRRSVYNKIRLYGITVLPISMPPVDLTPVP